MLYQGRLASARLALDPEHAVMRRKARAVAPFFELGGAEKPVAGSGQGGLDIVPARVAVCEAEGPEAVWSLLVVSLQLVRCDGR